jgi:hypothetical protein
LADSNNDEKITVDELKDYLSNALSNDPILKREKLQQTPEYCWP